MTLKACITVLGSMSLYCIYRRLQMNLTKAAIRQFLENKILLVDLANQYGLSEKQCIYLNSELVNYSVGDYVSIYDAIESISMHLQIQF